MLLGMLYCYTINMPLVDKQRRSAALVPDRATMLQYCISEPGDRGPVLSVADALEGASAHADRRRDRVFPAVVCLSIVAHAGVAALFLLGIATQNAGGGTTELDVISVSIVSANDLAPTANASDRVQVPQPAQVPDVPGSDAGGEAAPGKPEAKLSHPPELLLPAPTLDTSLLQVPPIIQDQRETKDVPPDSDRREVTSDRASEPGQAGSVSTATASVGGSATGEASASQGSMARYARDVALVVGRSRPKGVGLKGKVTVEFTLSADSGTLLTANVVKSSGSAKLDALAVAVIEKARYPTPPTGMTTSQLTYRVPFTFE